MTGPGFVIYQPDGWVPTTDGVLHGLYLKPGSSRSHQVWTALVGKAEVFHTADMARGIAKHVGARDFEIVEVA